MRCFIVVRKNPHQNSLFPLFKKKPLLIFNRPTFRILNIKTVAENSL